MKNNYANRNSNAGEYIAPVCEVFTLIPRRVICDSEVRDTEQVIEIEGEW